jgi:O-antigen/teichoic acid export membrane protein
MELFGLSLQKSRFTRDFIWNVASLGVLGVSGMLINSIILSACGNAALGVFNQVFAIYIIASQLAVGGLQFSTLKHCSHVQDNLPECALVTSSALMLVALLGLPICLGLFLLRPIIGREILSPAVAEGLGYAVPGLFLYSLNKVLLMVLNGLRHMRAFAIFQALRYLLILGGVILVIILGWPGSRLPLSLTLAEVLLFIGLWEYIRHKLFSLEFSFSAVMRSWFRRHLSFGTRGFLSGVLIEMNTRVDVLLIGYFLSDVMVGIYSFGAVFAEGFAQLCIVMRQNLDPLIGQAFAERDRERIMALSSKVRQKFLPLMVGLGAALVAGFPLLIWLISPDPANWKSWGILAILVGGIVVGASYRPFSGILLLGGRPGMFTFLMASSVTLNALLNLLLIPHLGIAGSALATSTVYMLEALAVVLMARQLFGIRL